jgi:UDP-N-acetylmuramate--alanine ligase
MIEAKSIHLIGIGGSGLSAIARVLVESGYRVTGSDQQSSPLALSLQDEGVPVNIGHQAENIGSADIVVISSAIPETNVELQAARAKDIPVLKRSDFLGEIMADKFVIAVAGSHGKTTTTAMVAWILTYLQQDPSYIIGGVSNNLNTNAHAGTGSTFVIEADEYDRMFIGLRPDIAVITNIEHDHPDYYPRYEDFFSAFLEFTSRITPKGLLIINHDDPGTAQLIAELSETDMQLFSFSLDTEEGDYKGENVFNNDIGGFSCEVRLPNSSANKKRMIKIELQIPGKHNILNAVAAAAVIDRVGLSVEKAASALREFTGTGRRFEVRGEVSGIVVIDDYAHHPTEIGAVLAAARARYPKRELWAVWQPHTYSRTRTMSQDFAVAFSDANHVLVTEIYPSREPLPADGFSARQVVRMMNHPDVHFIPGLTHVTMYLLGHLKTDDVLLVLSAGDADQISTYVLSALEEREHSHV